MEGYDDCTNEERKFEKLQTSKASTSSCQKTFNGSESSSRDDTESDAEMTVKAITSIEAVKEIIHEKDKKYEQLKRRYEELIDQHQKNENKSSDEMQVTDVINELKEQLREVCDERESLKHELNTANAELCDREQKIVDLSAQFEDMKQKKGQELSQIQAATEKSISSNIGTTIDSMATNSIATSIQLQSSYETNESENLEPQSLPTYANTDERTTQPRTIQELQNKIRSHEGTIQRLKDMNIQWQIYDRNKQKKIKSLEDQIDQKTREISQLKAQINSESTSSISFTPAQQEYIDGFYQRMRREADRYKDERDAARQEAQQSVTASQRRCEDAERRTENLRERSNDLEAQLSQQMEQNNELRTALVVATRSHLQQPTDHETISWREAARQYEQDYRKSHADYERVSQENQRLKEQIQQNMSSVRQTIVNLPGGTRSTTIQRSNGSTTIMQGGFPFNNQLFEDIETDSGSVHSVTSLPEPGSNIHYDTAHTSM